MEYIATNITSYGADMFFSGKSTYPFRSDTIEATLRFLALLKSGGSIDNIEPIKTKTKEWRRYDDLSTLLDEGYSDTELLLMSASERGIVFPTVLEDGWNNLDTPPYPVAPYLSRFSETHIYVNNSIKRTIVFVKTPTEKWIDAFCSIIFRVLPWRFVDENGAFSVSDSANELFRALNDKNGEKFTSIINTECEKYDFEAIANKTALSDWGSYARKQQIQQITNNINSSYEDVADYNERISSLMVSIDLMNQNLQALMNVKDDQSSNALYDFIRSHKELGIYEITNDESDNKVLLYSVAATIEYYDEDEFMRVYKNNDSYFAFSDMSRNNRNITVEEAEMIRKIFYYIFYKHKGLFRAETIFKLTNFSTICPVSHTRTGRTNSTHLPHPHLFHHACLGGNKTYIDKYMRQGDWDLAIEQTIAAVKNINFGDVVVMGDMISDIYRCKDSCKCIIAENGEEMTPMEFFEYCNKQEEQEEQE